MAIRLIIKIFYENRNNEYREKLRKFLFMFLSKIWISIPDTVGINIVIFRFGEIFNSCHLSRFSIKFKNSVIKTWEDLEGPKKFLGRCWLRLKRRNSKIRISGYKWSIKFWARNGKCQILGRICISFSGQWSSNGFQITQKIFRGRNWPDLSKNWAVTGRVRNFDQKNDTICFQKKIIDSPDFYF